MTPSAFLAPATGVAGALKFAIRHFGTWFMYSCTRVGCDGFVRYRVFEIIRVVLEVGLEVRLQFNFHMDEFHMQSNDCVRDAPLTYRRLGVSAWFL